MLRFDEPEADIHRPCEGLMRPDDVVGGQDGEDGFGIGAFEHGGGQSDGVDGVASDGLAEDAVIGELRHRIPDDAAVSLARADVASVLRDEAFEPIGGDLEKGARCPAWGALGDERDHLLRALGSAHRPQPRADSARHDHRVPHGSQSMCADVRQRRRQAVPKARATISSAEAGDSFAPAVTEATMRSASAALCPSAMSAWIASRSS